MMLFFFILISPSTLSLKVVISYPSRWMISSAPSYSQCRDVLRNTHFDERISLPRLPCHISLLSEGSVAHDSNILADLLIHEKHRLQSEELGASLSSHLCTWQLWVEVAVRTTALCVYTLLAVNGCVFTLDLIVSPPRLLLSTMFGTCLSAAVGCFKAGDTFVAVLVPAWVFVFWSLGEKKEIL